MVVQQLLDRQALAARLGISKERCGAKTPNSIPSNFSSCRRLTTSVSAIGLSLYPPQMYAQLPTEIFFLPMENLLVFYTDSDQVNEIVWLVAAWLMPG